jgi:hypothetical protein
MALLDPYASATVSIAGPAGAGPAALPGGHRARRGGGRRPGQRGRTASPGTKAWVLVEDEPAEVTVSVRDEGPGIAAERLAQAEEQGRLGVAQSIRGRIDGSCCWRDNSSR